MMNSKISVNLIFTKIIDLMKVFIIAKITEHSVEMSRILLHDFYGNFENFPWNQCIDIFYKVKLTKIDSENCNFRVFRVHLR